MNNLTYNTFIQLDVLLKENLPLIVDVKKRYKQLLIVSENTNSDFKEDMELLLKLYKDKIVIFELLSDDLNLKTPNNLFDILSDLESFNNFFSGSKSTYRRKFNKIKKARFKTEQKRKSTKNINQTKE